MNAPIDVEAQEARSSDERARDDGGKVRPIKRIVVAVCLQIGTGLAAAVTLARDSGREPLYSVFTLFLATGFSQCALAAMWFNLARFSLGKRVAGLIAGTVYLWLLLGFTAGAPNDVKNWSIAFALVACPVGLLAGALAVMRKRRPGFELVQGPSSACVPSAFQFTLRHVMTLIVAVAVVLTAGRAIREFQLLALPDAIGVTLLAVVLALCLTEAAIASLWASLSSGPIVMRLAVAMALALLTGLIPPFYFNASRQSYAWSSAAAILSQAFTIATLLVVRSCGYRLVRKASPQVASDPPAALMAHPLD